jgi:TPR repeat protein
MNYAQALDLLDLIDGVDETFITLAFEHKAAEIQTRIDSAPTDGLKAKFQQQLTRIEEACFIAMMGEEIAPTDAKQNVSSDVKKPVAEQVIEPVKEQAKEQIADEQPQLIPNSEPFTKTEPSNKSDAPTESKVTNKQQDKTYRVNTARHLPQKIIGLILIVLIGGIAANVGGSRAALTKTIINLLPASEIEINVLNLSDEAKTLQSKINNEQQLLTQQPKKTKHDEQVQDLASRVIFIVAKQSQIIKALKQSDIHIEENEFVEAQNLLPPIIKHFTRQLSQIENLAALVTHQQKVITLRDQWQLIATKADTLKTTQAVSLEQALKTVNEQVDQGELQLAEQAYLSLIDGYQQELQWSEVVVANTLEAYGVYRDNHPKSPYIGEAEQRSFTRANLANNQKGYQQYLASWPKGQYRDETQQKISQLKLHYKQQSEAQEKAKVQAAIKADNTDFAKAKKNNTEQSYKNYLATHSTGRHVQSAKKLADDLAFSAAKQTNTQAAYQDYQQRYKKGKHLKEANEALDYLVYLRAKKKNTVVAYQNFIKQHPDNKYVSEAIYTIGTMYSDINNKRFSTKQSLYWFNQAVERGHVLAMTAIGHLYYYVHYNMYDDPIALEWYLKAAKAGDGMAMYMLAWLYQGGQKIETSQAESDRWASEAVKVIKASASSGDAYYMFNLGGIYSSGYGGVKVDNEKSLFWYQKSAENGFVMAMQHIGYIYQLGQQGVEIDYQKALYWYLKAAEFGDVSAMNNLSVMYTHGLGVELDNKKAKAWYKKAVDLGYQPR